MPEDLNKKDNEAEKGSYLYYISKICGEKNKMGKMITGRVSFQRKLEDGLEYSSVERGSSQSMCLYLSLPLSYFTTLHVVEN